MSVNENFLCNILIIYAKPYSIFHIVSQTFSLPNMIVDLYIVYIYVM